MNPFALLIPITGVIAFELMVRLYRRGKVPAIALFVVAANILMVMIGATVQAIAPGTVVPTSRTHTE